MFIISTFFIHQKVYAMTDEFVWNEDERGVKKVEDEDNVSLTFTVIERTYNEKWWKEAICFNWFEKAFYDGENNYDGVIDREGIEYYNDQIIAASAENINRQNVKKEVVENVDEFESAKELFEDMVGKKTEDIQELWNGYEAGKIVQRYNDTSENVFQTGVLAESAHVHAANSDSVSEMTIKYAAATFEQFDKFLQFDNLYIGGDVFVTQEEVYFRKGKIVYVESKYGVQNLEVKAHCGVFVYAYFSYLADKTKPTDPFYLLYIYYSGKAYLNIRPDITNEVYREELCNIELGRWENVVDEIKNYELEGLEIDTILSVKESLENAKN